MYKQSSFLDRDGVEISYNNGFEDQHFPIKEIKKSKLKDFN